MFLVCALEIPLNAKVVGKSLKSAPESQVGGYSICNASPTPAECALTHARQHIEVLLFALRDAHASRMGCGLVLWPRNALCKRLSGQHLPTHTHTRRIYIREQHTRIECARPAIKRSVNGIVSVWRTLARNARTRTTIDKQSCRRRRRGHRKQCVHTPAGLPHALARAHLTRCVYMRACRMYTSSTVFANKILCLNASLRRRGVRCVCVFKRQTRNGVFFILIEINR